MCIRDRSNNDNLNNEFIRDNNDNTSKNMVVENNYMDIDCDNEIVEKMCIRDRSERE